MMKVAMWRALGLAAVIVLAGCHADENDPEGQAEELEDPVRRANAVSNIQRIYTSKLADKGGDRNDPEVKAIANVVAEPLSNTYVNHPEDTQNGKAILELLKEMRDPRTLPALIKALDWRTEVTEDHAITAAQTIQAMEVPPAKRPEVVKALASALNKITGSRSVDQKMRLAFLQALGSLESGEATETLVGIATTVSEEQPFLINRIAAQQVGQLADANAVPAMIQSLFLYGAEDPRFRMNDVAVEALVRIGRPALEPLLKVLRGQDEQAKATAKSFIDALKERDLAAPGLTAESLMSAEATFALGMLGFREALEPLLREASSDDAGRKMNAAVALVKLNLQPADIPRVVDVLKSAYNSQPDGLAGAAAKVQLIAAMRHLYDPQVIDFFLDRARDTDSHPDVRIQALQSAALLANKSEASRVRQVVSREKSSEDGGYQEKFKLNEPMLALADACDENLSCWVEKLKEDRGEMEEEQRVLLARKAAAMLGRYGRGSQEAIDALVEELGSDDIHERLSALSALDKIAVEGSQAAIDRIERMRTEEEGRRVWTDFRREALPIQARLRARASS